MRRLKPAALTRHPAPGTEHFIEQTTPLLPEGDDRETQPTLSFQRVLQRAVFHVQSSGRNEVNGANVLVAHFSEQESQGLSAAQA